MIETINDAFSQVTDKLLNWINSAIEMVPNFIIAVLTIILFHFITRIIVNVLKNTLSRFSKNTTINNLIISLTKISVFLVGIFIALSILKLDKTVTSILAGIGIIGLALGFAFKDAAANLLSGIYMAITSPINVDDIVEYKDIYGHVKNIGLRATTITTFQGQDVVIPNRLIFENPYRHYTINKTRRIDLDVGISYGDDLEKAENITLEAVHQVKNILPGKPVDLYYTEFGDSSINFTVRYWIAFKTETDYLSALSQGIKNIKKAYNEHGITITFPIRTLDFGIKGGTTLAEMINKKTETSKQKVSKNQLLRTSHP